MSLEELEKNLEFFFGADSYKGIEWTFVAAAATTFFEMKNYKTFEKP